MPLDYSCFAAGTPQEQQAWIAQAIAAWSGNVFDPHCAVEDPSLANFAIYNAFTTDQQNEVYTSTPVTGGTVLAPTYLVGGYNARNYLTPAGTLATLTYSLPASADSVVGMIRSIFTTQIITAITVNTVGGGTIQGTALTTLAANTGASYQCVSVAGAGTWIRTS